MMRTQLLIFGLAAIVAGCGRNEAAAPQVDEPKVAAAAPSGADSTPPPPATAAAEATAPAVAPPENVAAATKPEPAAEEKPKYREVTIPAGTTLPLTLQTAVASDTSNVEDTVRATLGRPITVQGLQALPQGTTFIGHVTDAKQSARVKGRARVAFRFTRADLPGDGTQVNVRTSTVSREAQATKKRDAATIGGGAVGGAIVGGIVGGGDGAAKGAAIGGAGGTGVVLATRGKEVRLPSGTAVSVKLTAPLTVRVPVN